MTVIDKHLSLPLEYHICNWICEVLTSRRTHTGCGWQSQPRSPSGLCAHPLHWLHCDCTKHGWALFWSLLVTHDENSGHESLQWSARNKIWIPNFNQSHHQLVAITLPCNVICSSVVTWCKDTYLWCWGRENSCINIIIACPICCTESITTKLKIKQVKIKHFWRSSTASKSNLILFKTPESLLAFDSFYKLQVKTLLKSYQNRSILTELHSL